MTIWFSYWWCDHCCVEVPSENATIAFTHALAGGGCGKRLTERFNSTEPPEDDELAAALADRDRLAAENARLREAVNMATSTLEWVLCDVRGWCDAVERDSSWDSWDGWYKDFANRTWDGTGFNTPSALEKAEASLTAARSLVEAPR